MRRAPRSHAAHHPPPGISPQYESFSAPPGNSSPPPGSRGPSRSPDHTRSRPGLRCNFPARSRRPPQPNLLLQGSKPRLLPAESSRLPKVSARPPHSYPKPIRRPFPRPRRHQEQCCRWRWCSLRTRWELNVQRLLSNAERPPFRVLPQSSLAPIPAPHFLPLTLSDDSNTHVRLRKRPRRRHRQ